MCSTRRPRRRRQAGASTLSTERYSSSSAGLEQRSAALRRCGRGLVVRIGEEPLGVFGERALEHARGLGVVSSGGEFDGARDGLGRGEGVVDVDRVGRLREGERGDADAEPRAHDQRRGEASGVSGGVVEVSAALHRVLAPRGARGPAPWDAARRPVRRHPLSIRRAGTLSSSDAAPDHGGGAGSGIGSRSPPRRVLRDCSVGKFRRGLQRQIGRADLRLRLWPKRSATSSRR